MHIIFVRKVSHCHTKCIFNAVYVLSSNFLDMASLLHKSFLLDERSG